MATVKKMEDCLTPLGKKYMEQAKDYNMLEFYDIATGIFTIPKKDVDNDFQIKDTMIEMLIHWDCYDEDSQLALTIESHIEDGEEVDGEWDYVLRVIERFC